MQLLHETLEKQSQQFEFKSVQLEGEINSLKEKSDKYKEDAHTLLKQTMQRTSELRKEDVFNQEKIATLEEAVQSQKE